MNPKLSPERNKSHRNEDLSKRDFEALIDPCFIRSWSQRDYTIDGLVDIVRTTDSKGNGYLANKSFNIQIKSVEVPKRKNDTTSYPLPVKKINSWYDHNIPVLFALYDVGTGKIYYQWIDDLLIAALDAANGNWRNQQSVTIKIPETQLLLKTNFQEVFEHVYRWKSQAVRKLEPGKYFELQGQCNANISKLKAINEPFRFDSINQALSNLEAAVEKSIYRIAITGPSRVGKSSLINRLLKKEVSPTGIFQTTGVPIQVIPGKVNEVNVYFKDKAVLKEPFTLQNVEQYSSQQFNEDNNKGVTLLSISIDDLSLESGISLYDVPGLDDPSDEIQAYTWQAVNQANAVIYIMDASTMLTGGFIFRKDIKKHITDFKNSKDKIFLVLNKVDVLPESQLEQLKERVAFDLEKHDLTDILKDKVLYLSAEGKQSCPGTDTVEDLNQKIWAYILQENKSGIVKIQLLNKELLECSRSFSEIINARLMDRKMHQQLREAISTVKNIIPVLDGQLKERHTDSRKLLTSMLDNKRLEILKQLETFLLSIPIENELLSGREVKNYLHENVNNTIVEANKEYALQVNQLKNFIDEWIEQNLKQVREILGNRSATRNVDFGEIEAFELPEIDLSSALGMGAIGMVAGALLMPALVFEFLVVGFFGSLITSAESNRKKRIGRIMKDAHSTYEISFTKLKKLYDDWYNEQMWFLVTYINQKLNIYFRDIEIQLAAVVQSDIPQIGELYSSGLNEIEHFQKEVLFFDSEVRSFNL